MKVLFGLPLRQATGLVASLLGLAALDCPVLDSRRRTDAGRRSPCSCSTGARAARCTGSEIARASRSASKANGFRASAAALIAYNMTRLRWLIGRAASG
ncbi:transposase [Jannaschia formosa]|uniref:transposase n=1 Tax=Jannaschia formosa TaxID=2259592 RepID=UPI000E1BBCB9|nr:hypothetical protein DR046_17785 [Jannaschia formosa]